MRWTNEESFVHHLLYVFLLLKGGKNGQEGTHWSSIVSSKCRFRDGMARRLVFVVLEETVVLSPVLLVVKVGETRVHWWRSTVERVARLVGEG